MKVFFALCISTLLYVSSNAQSLLYLSGLLKDESTQLPVSNANIIILRSGLAVMKSSSDARGYFSANLMLNQEYQIRIQHPGYLEEKLNLSTIFPVKLDSLPQLDILLIPVSTDSKTIITQPITIENNSVQKVNCKLEGKIFSRDLGLLPDQEITLVNIRTKAKEIKQAASDGSFEFMIQPDQNYHLFIEPDTSSPFVFSDVYLSTVGVKNPLTIIRNIERQVNPEKAKLFLPKPTQPVEIKKEKPAKTNTQKTPAPVVTKEPKAPKTKAQKSIVARNVVVKISDVEKQKPTQKVEKVRSVDTIVLPPKPTKSKEKSTEKTEPKKAEEAKIVAQPIDSTEILQKIRKQQEKEAYARRLDSMIGNGPRFMHKEDGYDKRNSPNSRAIAAGQSLPVGVDETRTPVIENKIYYGPGKAELDSNAIRFLLKLADTLKNDPSKRLIIKVFCDNNLEKTVQGYLNKLRISRINAVLLGVETPFNQLEIRLLGGQLPANPCTQNMPDCSELDHQMNRRTEFSWFTEEN